MSRIWIGGPPGVFESEGDALRRRHWSCSYHPNTLVEPPVSLRERDLTQALDMSRKACAALQAENQRLRDKLDHVWQAFARESAR